MRKIKNPILKLKNLLTSDFNKATKETASNLAMLSLSNSLDIEIPQEQKDEILKQATLFQVRRTIHDFSKTKKVRGLVFLASAAVASTVIGTALALTDVAVAGVVAGTVASILPGGAFATINFLESRDLEKQGKTLDDCQEKFINQHFNDKDDFYMATARVLDAKNTYLKELNKPKYKIFEELPDDTLSKQSNFLLDYCSDISDYIYGKEEREL